MKKIKDFLKGKKAYLTAALILVAGLLSEIDIGGEGGFEIPEYVWTSLAAAAIAALRAGMKKSECRCMQAAPPDYAAFDDLTEIPKE